MFGQNLPHQTREHPKGDYKVKSRRRVYVGHLVNPYAETCGIFFHTA